MGYAFQATVVIPAATGSTLTNFSVAITGTAAQMKTVANGGQVVNTVSRVGQTVPADLILSSDAAGTSLYKWGWEKYVATTGEAIMWVLIPSLTTGASITIYVSVGNAAVSTYQGGTQGQEFDANSSLVAHFPDGTTLSVRDFSANNTTMTNSGAAAVAGKVDGGANCNPTGFVTATYQSSLAATQIATYSCWVNVTTFPAVGQGFYGEIWNQFIASAIFFSLGDGSSPNAKRFSLTIFNGGFVSAGVNNTDLTASTWTHIAITTDGTNAKFYLNGAADGSGAFSATPSAATSNPVIGQLAAGGRQLLASLDELRIVYGSARSADWIANEYANQNSIPTIGTFAATGRLFRVSALTGLGSGGGFFQNPLN